MYVKALGILNLFILPQSSFFFPLYKVHVLARNSTYMTGKHVEEKVECSTSPCRFSKYARSSRDFFVQREYSKNPGYILKKNDILQQILGVQRI